MERIIDYLIEDKDGMCIDTCDKLDYCKMSIERYLEEDYKVLDYTIKKKPGTNSSVFNVKVLVETKNKNLAYREFTIFKCIYNAN